MHALILSSRCAGCGWPCGERADLLLKMYNEGMKCYECLFNSDLFVFYRIGLRLGAGVVFPKALLLLQSGAQMDQPRFLHRPLSADLWFWALRLISSGTAWPRDRA